MKSKNTALNFIIILLSSASLILLLTFWFNSENLITPSYKLSPLESENISNIINNPKLTEKYLESYGPKKLMEKLLKDSGNESEFNCHRYAHQIGKLSYKVLGAQKALKEGTGECHSGYFHGATEGFFSENGTANLKINLIRLCSRDLNPFFRHQCYHGVGHGLMGWANYEINEALQNCELLENSANLSSCTTGVFMENYTGAFQKNQSKNADHISKYLSEDPHFPCNIVDKKHKYNCYFLQTSRMLQLFGINFQKVVQECKKVAEEYQSACFQSMGRDVGGFFRNNPQAAIETCIEISTKNQRINCLNEAAQYTFWTTEGQNIAIKFCKLLINKVEKDSCYSTIFDRAVRIISSQKELTSFCLKVESSHQKICLTQSLSQTN